MGALVGTSLDSYHAELCMLDKELGMACIGEGQQW